MPFVYWYDWTILLMIPAILFALYAQSKVNSSYKKYSTYYSRKGYTAAQVARMILDSNGLNNVNIERIPGQLTDNFNPTDNTVHLSDSVFDSTSVAAIGVAAHECGHAVQHSEGYVPIKIRSAIIPITNFGARFSTLFIMIGLVIAGFSYNSNNETGIRIAFFGVALYALVAVFQFVTLPVEFNASSRALKTLESYDILQPDELVGARKVLSAAALTYVAALASTLMTLLRLFIIVAGRSNNRRR